MIHYREAKTSMKTASVTKHPIGVYGDLPSPFVLTETRYLGCFVFAHVPSFSYHRFSLRVATDGGLTYTGTSDGVMVDLITGEKLFF